MEPYNDLLTCEEDLDEPGCFLSTGPNWLADLTRSETLLAQQRINEDLPSLFERLVDDTSYLIFDGDDRLSALRRRLVVFLMQHAEYCSFELSTLVLATQLFDATLSHFYRKSRSYCGVHTLIDMGLKKPELLALLCLSIARKVNENFDGVPLFVSATPGTRSFAPGQSKYIDVRYIVHYGLPQKPHDEPRALQIITSLECMVLKVLDWRVHRPTVFSFLDAAINLIDDDDAETAEMLRHHSSEIIRLILPEPEFTRFRPPVLAVSVLLVSFDFAGISHSSVCQTSVQPFAARLDQDEVQVCFKQLYDFVEPENRELVAIDDDNPSQSPLVRRSVRIDADLTMQSPGRPSSSMTDCDQPSPTKLQVPGLVVDVAERVAKPSPSAFDPPLSAPRSSLEPASTSSTPAPGPQQQQQQQPLSTPSSALLLATPCPPNVAPSFPPSTSPCNQPSSSCPCPSSSAADPNPARKRGAFAGTRDRDSRREPLEAEQQMQQRKRARLVEPLTSAGKVADPDDDDDDDDRITPVDLRQAARELHPGPEPAGRSSAMEWH
eukprot:Rmarinus@m.26667